MACIEIHALEVSSSISEVEVKFQVKPVQGLLQARRGSEHNSEEWDKWGASEVPTGPRCLYIPSSVSCCAQLSADHASSGAQNRYKYQQTRHER